MRKPQLLMIAALWVLAGTSVVAYLGMSRARAVPQPEPAAAAEPLAPLYPVGTFAMTDHAGARFGSDDLAGKAWVGFIFLRNCPTGSCPTMIAKMADLQAALPASEFGDRVQFVSFTIDPERDTPEALSEYALNASRAAGRDEIDPRWHLLTGTPEQVRQASAAMRLGFDAESFEHNTQFLLVDGRGTVRGVYRNSDPADMDRLAADARLLLSK